MTDLEDIIARLKGAPEAFANRTGEAGRREGFQALMVFADGSARAVYQNRAKLFRSAEELAAYQAEDGCEFHI
jgi:hypothetical protein